MSTQSKFAEIIVGINAFAYARALAVTSTNPKKMRGKAEVGDICALQLIIANHADWRLTTAYGNFREGLLLAACGSCRMSALQHQNQDTRFDGFTHLSYQDRRLGTDLTHIANANQPLSVSASTRRRLQIPKQ